MTYDLFVIGGGINGTGVARDAAGRGLKVGLCERDDLGAHTSSASTKLIHGGLRYLEQGRLGLVAHSLRERATLARLAPHLVRPLRFIAPDQAGVRPAWLVGAGLGLYDLMGGSQGLPRARRVRLDGAAFAGALSARFTTGHAYWDRQGDDSRLVALNAVDARERGADIFTRTGCVALRRDGEGWTVALRAREGGMREVRARALVNAAGAWAGEIARWIAPERHAPKLRLVKGSHIVTRRLFEGEHAFLLQNADRRVVFLIPFEGDHTLIGTTDVPVGAPNEGSSISAAETAYLCAAASAYLAKPVTPGDVVWSFAGLRALHDGGAGSASQASREDVLRLDGQGAAVTILGGKLTTYRGVAERALGKLAPRLPGMGRPWTARVPLPGGDMPEGGFDAFLADAQARHGWLPRAMLRRMARAYGTRLCQVLDGARSLGDLGRAFGAGLYEREIAYLMADEFARLGADVLWRRTKLGLQMSPAERQAVADWVASRDGASKEPPRTARGAACA